MKSCHSDFFSFLENASFHRNKILNKENPKQTIIFSRSRSLLTIIFQVNNKLQLIYQEQKMAIFFGLCIFLHRPKEQSCAKSKYLLVMLFKPNFLSYASFIGYGPIFVLVYYNRLFFKSDT